MAVFTGQVGLLIIFLLVLLLLLLFLLLFLSLFFLLLLLLIQLLLLLLFLQVEAVKLLLDSQASPDQLDDDGETAVHAAVREDSMEILQV